MVQALLPSSRNVQTWNMEQQQTEVLKPEGQQSDRGGGKGGRIERKENSNKEYGYTAY